VRRPAGGLVHFATGSRAWKAWVDLVCLPDTVDPRGPEGDVSDTDARLWHPWLRINRLQRVMLDTRWSEIGSA
jgi:hypothetical protein